MGLKSIYNYMLSFVSPSTTSRAGQNNVQTNPISSYNIEPQNDNEPARVDSATVLAQYYNIHQTKNSGFPT